MSKDGPYVITGSVDLIGDNIQFGEGVSKEHYTLCRCGASNNKPFCDGCTK
ncbi:MAG: CDGSH iron-sulfur domain-containing protein [Nitrososphaeraceae archaeon]